MINFIKKIIFAIKKPSVVLIIGKDGSCVLERIQQTLKKLKKETVYLVSDLKKEREFNNLKFLLAKSRMPILVITAFEESLKEEDSLKIIELAKFLRKQGFIIANFAEGVKDFNRRIKNETKAQFLNYGLEEGAGLKATDINTGQEGINFKVSYEGDIVPFWLKIPATEKDLPCVLAVISINVAEGFNLVEISQSLK